MDSISSDAAHKIRVACDEKDLAVHFLVGGTQTNLTVISAALRPHHGVVSADTGHVNVHETGAIEATGHKVIALDSVDGKITAQQVMDVAQSHVNDPDAEHTVKPKLVYISFPTEYGTIYSLDELKQLSEVCHQHDIPLYIDGARLGYALGSSEADFTLEDIARLADVFYIGGTKMGTLFGEALVVTNRALLKNLFPLVKQHGALLAKGRLLGIQFGIMFSDGLYEQLGRHATALAQRVKEIFRSAGYKIMIDSPTNQQFVELPNSVIDRLRENASFDYWGPRGEEQSIVRFVTSWATTESDIDELERLINEL
jgi:threonine aldolase